jgi:hypothetical protein
VKSKNIEPIGDADNDITEMEGEDDSPSFIIS